MRRLTLALLCILTSYTGNACGDYSDMDREMVRKNPVQGKGMSLGSTKVVFHLEVRQKEEVKKGSTKALVAKPKGNDKSSNNRQSREWKRAVFRGLTVGKSTEGDLLRVLGTNTIKSPPSTLYGITWYLYNTDTPFKGRLHIEVNAGTKKIEHISFSPMVDLSVDEVIKHYGENYVITKYAPDLCLEDDMEGIPSYESPEGNDSVIEYRSLGISISSGLSIDGQEKVTSINYQEGPSGTEKSRCIELETGSQGQVQECRDWGTKCWTPYEVVHCDHIKNTIICLIYVKPKFFNKESMSNLARHFSKWSPEIREGVNLYLYDDKSLIESYLRSRGHDGNKITLEALFESYLQSRGHDTGMINKRRGFYMRGGGRERLIIYENENGKEEGIIIK